MTMGKDVSKLSVYVPHNQMDKHLIERLIKLSAQKDRSVNYLVVKSIEQYLRHEEGLAKRRSDALSKEAAFGDLA